MSGFLIAVKSCVRDIPMHQLIRESWAQYLPDEVGLRFFVGDAPWAEMLSPLKWDEIQLTTVPDDYAHLPEKVRGICDWVSKQHYDHVMLIDNDTFIHPQRLMEIVNGKSPLGNFTDIDYFGKFFWKSQFPWATTGDYRFAFGGLGYILSHRAATSIATTETHPEYRNEDEWIGGVFCQRPYVSGDSGETWRIQEANRMKFERYVSWHYPKDTYSTAWRYASDSQWQRVMTYQHLGGAPGPNPNAEQATLVIDDRKPFPELAKPLPDLRTEFRDLRTSEQDIDRAISRLIVTSVNAPQEKLLELQYRLTSLSLVREIESKPSENILRSEWAALATAYNDLGQFDRALQCAWIAYEEPTSANKIKLAQACDAAGKYKLAHKILLNLYSNSKDYNLLPLLRVAAKRAQ